MGQGGLNMQTDLVLAGSTPRDVEALQAIIRGSAVSDRDAATLREKGWLDANTSAMLVTLEGRTLIDRAARPR
jgi:hypothetical protein